jgi:hypothetical protein
MRSNTSSSGQCPLHDLVAVAERSWAEQMDAVFD